MKPVSLAARLREAANKGRGVRLERIDLALVYTAARARLGAGNAFVEEMRQAVLAGAGFRIKATDVETAIEAMEVGS